MIAQLSKQSGIDLNRSKRILQFFDEGASVPFLARYRKEATGGLDEVQLESFLDLKEKLERLEKRKEHILEVIRESGKLDEKLENQILKCYNEQELEDLYLPFKKKRKTRADKARELGLEGLAKQVMAQGSSFNDNVADRYIKGEIENREEAITGARDIIAEWTNENQFLRSKLRNEYRHNAELIAKVVKSKISEAERYRDYFDYAEKLKRIPSHRFLAISRAVNESLLRLKVIIDVEKALHLIQRTCGPKNGLNDIIIESFKDAYKRLIQPSLETEFSSIKKEEADAEAIRVFSNNLEQLLLSAPLSSKNVLAIDPGFRTGCKLACISQSGDYLEDSVIFPHPPQNKMSEAAEQVEKLISKYKIEAIAIGNATAGRETRKFIEDLKLEGIEVFTVDEAGASIYSASTVAREEFPKLDATVRGAISIGRRLQDPLAELVKIDPKSIGVGQYQHDVDQKELKKALDRTVVNAVNKIGVRLDTAGPHLLKYVSGLGESTAKNIVKFRSDRGSFDSLKQLLEVPKVGKKVFEQCAGFLRLPNSQNPLDGTAIHPEAYGFIQKIIDTRADSLEEILGNKEKVLGLKLIQFANEEYGKPSLELIENELIKGHRDPRSQAKSFSFAEHINTIDDLREGEWVPGIVNNLTKFGAFVDIGIKENGLLHISEIADRFISDPAEELKLKQELKVKVLEIDKARSRIALSLKNTDG